MKNLWNEKSKKYPRYSHKMPIFNEAIMLNLKEIGIDFFDKNIIDIGCGTGVWTLHFAKMCKKVTALDSSESMLEFLKIDANKNGFENLEILNLDWGEFKSDEVYDIAVSTMSPAIKNEIDFLKFKNLANTKIYINFARPRYSSLVNPYLEKFNVTNRCGSATKTLEIWLKQNDIKFRKLTFGEVRVAFRDKTETFENLCWHLDINGAKYDKISLKSEIENLKSDKILEEIESLITLFVF